MRRAGTLSALMLMFLVGPFAWGAELTGAEFAAPDEIDTHLVKVLRTTNKAQTNRFVPRVYDFANVNPYDVLRFIVRVAQIEEGAWFVYGKPTDPDDPTTVKGGKVAMVVPIYQLPYVDELMETIDREGLTTSSGDEAYYYRPRHRHVDDGDFVDLINAVLAINHSSGDQVPDNEVNAYLFYDSPSSIEDVQRWLPVLDQPPPQVMLEATLYEVNVENDSALGLDVVSWKNGPGRDLFTVGAFWEKERVPTLRGTGVLVDHGVPGGTHALSGHDFLTHGTYYSYLIDLPSEFFDFLVTKQKARVLASAKLLSRSGVPAVLSSGDRIFFWRTNDDADIERIVVGDSVARELGSESTGVFLRVEPIIGEEGIQLEIEVDVVGNTGFGTDGRPEVVRRNFDTNVRVQDGQEIVLGGYTREMVVQQANKIPVLGSIPFMGWLFGGEQNLVKKRKVVVVLTANIVKDFSAMTGAGSEIDAALIRSRARGEWPMPDLKTEAGFDQWIFDTEGTE